MDIANLIQRQESEVLDFKDRHHADTLSLLHDILCLANAWAESDRFLVFGVSDAGTVTGVEQDPNRRAGAQVQDLLRASRLNRLPTVSMETHKIAEHEVDVLIIRNRPDKPFFVSADKEYQGRTIRAGVVYTRIGDTNVPLRESATEASMELAWRERFGLGLPPLRRAFRLLEQPERWEKVEGEAYLYHHEFPEFTIVEGKTLVAGFREPWTQEFPDPAARSYVVQLRFGTTILRELIFVSCDGGRYSLPLPRVNEAGRYEINRNSLAWCHRTFKCGH
jgi:hypothetical protein